MSDAAKLDDEVRVIAEFGDVSDGTSYVEHGMAREILRLRRILAALREPSEQVVESVLEKYGLIDAIRAAVAAAEQEVGRE